MLYICEVDIWESLINFKEIRGHIQLCKEVKYHRQGTALLIRKQFTMLALSEQQRKKKGRRLQNDKENNEWNEWLKNKSPQNWYVDKIHSFHRKVTGSMRISVPGAWRHMHRMWDVKGRKRMSPHLLTMDDTKEHGHKWHVKKKSVKKQ